MFKKSFLYFKKYIPIHLLCLILGLMRMIILLVEPQIISLMVDRVINPALGAEAAANSSIFSFAIKEIAADDYLKAFGILVIIFLITMLLYLVAFFTRWNISHWIGLKSENRMRQDAFDKINRVGDLLQNKYTSGELITISGSDPAHVKDVYICTIPFIADCVFYILAAAYFLYRINRIFLLFPLMSGLVFILLTKRFIKKIGSYYEELWEKNTSLNTMVQESIYGIRIIKSMAKEKHLTEKFQEKNRELKDFYYRMGDFRAKYNAFYGIIRYLFYFLSIIAGMVLAVNMAMTSGEFISFLSYLLTISGQFIGIIYLLGDLQNGLVSCRRFFSFLEDEGSKTKAFGTEVLSGRPSIEIADLSVVHEGSVVLDHISLSIPYGKKIGIMGSSGAGKSILLKALQGMVEYDTGTIQLDHREMHCYAKEEIRRIYGYAMQEVFLFSNTITANIAFYNPEGDEKKVMECAKAACVDEFAGQFPDEYETIIGEKGFGLSGGQKQRIAIARAFYKNAPVLLFDDCTSALDMETERKIFDNMKTFYQGKTQIIATHRAFAVQDADEILFMEKGQVVERGTHRELMELNGRYAGIYRHQSGELIVNG